MRERPIIFSAPMVRAILDGRKTQTRRVVKRLKMHADHGEPQWETARNDASYAPIPCLKVTYDGCGIAGMETTHRHWCPYGVPGDRLWVRETWCKTRNRFLYRASCADDKPSANTDDWDAPTDDRWRPSILMPRKASRLTLEITGVRVERVQAISEEDAIAEGVQTHAQHYGVPEEKLYGTTPWYRYDGRACSAMSAKESYMTLWESINGKGSWAENPWVWVVEFKRVGGVG